MSVHPTKHQRACELAKEILVSDIDYLDNVIEMWKIGNSIHGSVWDTEFHIFGVIESSTDHLPTKTVREHYSKEWLLKADQEISKCIIFYRENVKNACTEILSKYNGL